MHGWTSLAFPSRRKKPAVFAVVHEIGCISLTFTGATGGGVDRRASQKSLPTPNTQGHLKMWAFLFLFPTWFQTETQSVEHETPRLPRIRSCWMFPESTEKVQSRRGTRPDGCRPPACRTETLQWPFAGRSSAGNYSGLAGSGVEQLSAL